jgi:pantothenate kinase
MVVATVPFVKFLLVFWSIHPLYCPACRTWAWTAPFPTRGTNERIHPVSATEMPAASDLRGGDTKPPWSASSSTLDSNFAVPTIIPGPQGRPLRVTWEVSVAREIVQRAREARRPYLVAIAGIPGSGKSSSAALLTHFINQESDGICVCLPADGYHYSKEQLQQRQVATGDATLVYRRGAPETFDVAALVRDLQRIRQAEEEVQLPGFDHAVGDPTPDQHVYQPTQHAIVLMEGLYLLHDQHGWQEVQQYFDFSIYIQTSSIDECMARLKERNVCVPGYTPEEIYERVDQVDRRNALQIAASSPSRASLVIGNNHGPIMDEHLVEE